MALQWIERLSSLQPQNQWRIIPIANPDGFVLSTRTNVHGVDLNRYFPSADWDQSAWKYWKTGTRSNPRRFPGNKAGSEPETRCLLELIADFQPDLLVSIQTPYGLIDFDGPKDARPPAPPGLPVKKLGTCPGSLGRYSWGDHEVPVLTIELKEGPLVFSSIEGGHFQDLLAKLTRDVTFRELKTKRIPASKGTESSNLEIR